MLTIREFTPCINIMHFERKNKRNTTQRERKREWRMEIKQLFAALAQEFWSICCVFETLFFYSIASHWMSAPVQLVFKYSYLVTNVYYFAWVYLQSMILNATENNVVMHRKNEIDKRIEMKRWFSLVIVSHARTPSSSLTTTLFLCLNNRCSIFALTVSARDSTPII